MSPALEDFRAAVLLANAAAEGDSNDAEIDTLRDAVHLACGLLGVDPETGDPA